ncbi:hypothetical protein EJ07DRAFT_173418 [Lizonia empirigonia]|nr:hypothetical protein EJ07DRAFT_173418 [Lizonia empirigonia]
MTQFYIPSSLPSSSRPSTSTSSTSSDDLATLPFAAPLSRSDFLAPTFTPHGYLATLSARHQTLEDLRSELRTRSQQLSRELLDLVNANYADFLTLGNSLRGGEERVEGVRVGLLGFAKEVEGLRAEVARRGDEVGRLLELRRELRGRIEEGRRLVEFDERLRECEEGLVVGLKEGGGSDSSEEEEEEEEEDEHEDAQFGTSVVRLRRNVVLYRLVKEGVKGCEEHPFVLAQSPRLAKVRSTLLLDLSTALQQARRAGPAASGRVMQIMKIYADMGEVGEAVRVLKTRTR